MDDQTPPPTLPDAKPGAPASYLAQDYHHWVDLFNAQPGMLQRFLETQARNLAEAALQNSTNVRFSLPDRVVIKVPENGEGKGETRSVPADQREQMAGGLMDRMTRANLFNTLRARLAELETSPNQAIATSAGLLRFASAWSMVHSMLPSGRSITYMALEGEETPSLPVSPEMEPGSAIMAATDAVVEAEAQAEEGRGELQVPYVPAARRFFLPQWVAFDEHDGLLVGSLQEAEAHISSMQRYLKVLHAAVGLAPYIVADAEYQQKRYGVLGQLVNQGRAFTRYQTREIIATIQRRSSASDLNRGLSLSLPYFDDQMMQVVSHGFEIIPAGRIMFVPAFVVRASLEEQGKVAQDTRLNQSTRKHLLGELEMLEEAFA